MNHEQMSVCILSQQSPVFKRANTCKMRFAGANIATFYWRKSLYKKLYELISDGEQNTLASESNIMKTCEKSSVSCCIKYEEEEECIL